MRQASRCRSRLPQRIVGRLCSLLHISCRFCCYNRGMNETGGQNAAVAGLHFLQALHLHCRRFWYERAGMKISVCNGFITTRTEKLRQNTNPA